MATVESMVKMINKRLSDIYKAFEPASPEYQQATALLFSGMGDNGGIFVNKETGKPPKLSRSKKALEAYKSNPYFLESIPEVLRDIRGMGTVREMVMNRLTEEEKKQMKASRTSYKNPEIIKKVRERATTDYISRYDDVDLYALINDIEPARAEGDMEYLQELEEASEMFYEKTGRGNSAAAEAKYNRIEQKFYAARERHMRRMMGEDVEEDVDLSDYDMSL